MLSRRDPSTIDPSLYFHQQAINKPTIHRTNNSHIKLIFDHEDVTCKRVLHFLRDNGVEPDLIHYRYSPLSRRELTGLLKSIPQKDLEFFVRLRSQRYQQQPFTISQQTHEQTINHILPHQYDLLGAPIVYNVLSNQATVIPPLPSPVESSTSTKQRQHHNDVSLSHLSHAEYQSVVKNFEKILPLIARDAVGANEMWDNGGDLFPVPAHLNSSRNQQQLWEKERYQRERDRMISASKRPTTPAERTKMIDDMIDKQLDQFKGTYDSLRQQQLENLTKGGKGNRSNQIRYDPRTGKPTPQSLGLEGFGGNEGDDGVMNFDYPGDQLRIDLKPQKPLTKSQQDAEKLDGAMLSREQWRKKQEREFGRLDNSEFDQWRRQRAEKQRMERYMSRRD